VGAASLVLIVVAVALAGPARALLPRGTWTFLVASAAAWTAIVYTGLGLSALQHLPVFSANFIGRGRSVLGFLLAVLAAVGLDLLLRRNSVTYRTGSHARRHPRLVVTRRVAWTAMVWAGAVVGTGALVWLARRTATTAPTFPATATSVVPDAATRLAFADRQLRMALILLVAAGICALVLYAVRWHRGLRAGAAAALLALLVGQALAYVGPAWPRSHPDTFFPWTDTQAFLASHLGPDRYVSTRNAMGVGIDAPKGLRTISGHTFLNAQMADMISAVPQEPFASPTYVRFSSARASVTSPILDRLAARYLVASPRDRVYGRMQQGHSDGTIAQLRPGVPMSAPLPTDEPVRAVGIIPAASAPGDGSLDVVITDSAGATVARGHRILDGLAAGQVLPVAVPQTAGCACSVTFTLTASRPLPIRSGAISTVTAQDDGLRLVHAGASVIYERLRALPRIRWASSSLVEPDRDRRLALLQSGTLRPDQVVLSAPTAPASGRPGQVNVIKDGSDAITIDVRAGGQGYVVVADALQAGWAARVDGAPARLIPADQGVVAVAVAAGTHRIELRYAAPYHGAGVWISLAALLAGVALLAAGARRSRRQRPPHRSASTTGDLA
jgi:hypothetical protein